MTKGSVCKQNKMSNTNITTDNNNRVTLDISRHELPLIKTCITLTMASIVETKHKGRDSSSISLDSNTLEHLYNKLESLSAKLEKKKRKGEREEREEKEQNYNDDEQHEEYKFSTKIDKIKVGEGVEEEGMNMKMEDNGDEWRIVEIDESK